MSSCRAFTEFLTQDEVASIRRSLAGFELLDGRTAAGAWAAEVKKNRVADPASSEPVGRRVLSRMFERRDVREWALPRRAIAPLFCRYAVGDRYGMHEDSPVQSGVRADLSYTLFLSSPDEYAGGDLLLGTDRAVPFREPAGTLVIYSSGMPHEVVEVTAGERWVAVGWVESMVRHATQREILADLSIALEDLHSTHGVGSTAFRSLNRAKGALVRLWIDPPISGR